jgi:hypothetical protein
MKVYVVMGSDTDDASVEYVFTRKEHAEAVVDAANAGVLEEHWLEECEVQESPDAALQEIAQQREKEAQERASMPPDPLFAATEKLWYKDMVNGILGIKE